MCTPKTHAVGEAVRHLAKRVKQLHGPEGQLNTCGRRDLRHKADGSNHIITSKKYVTVTSTSYRQYKEPYMGCLILAFFDTSDLI
jgi:hypothetical protein